MDDLVINGGTVVDGIRQRPTTAVMGNCGFTLAPVRTDAGELVVRNLERTEDVAAKAMAAGIDCWLPTSDQLCCL